MSPYVHKLVRAFEALPPDFSADDLEGAIVDALDGVPSEAWEAIAEEACDRYDQDARDRVTLLLAKFEGTRQ